MMIIIVILHDELSDILSLGEKHIDVDIEVIHLNITSLAMCLSE
jgi:hypothetical protein